MHINEENIDEEAKFVDIGLDSITGVTWIRKINKEYGLSITTTKVYYYPTLKEFAKYVMQEGKQQGIFLPSKNKKVAVVGILKETLKAGTLKDSFDQANSFYEIKLKAFLSRNLDQIRYSLSLCVACCAGFCAVVERGGSYWVLGLNFT